MYFGKKRQLDWTFVLIVGDLIACVLAERIAWLVLPWLPGSELDLPIPSGIVYILLAFASLRYLHLYSWFAFRHPLAAIPRIGVASALATGVFALLFAAFGSEWGDALVQWLIALFFSTLVVVLVGRCVVFVLLARVLKSVQIERVAFVGAGVRVFRVLDALRQGMGEFHQAVGYFGVAPMEDKHVAAYRWLGPVKDVEKQLIDNEVTLLVVEENAVSKDELEAIAASCGRAMVGLKIIPSVFDFWSTRLSFRTVAGIPLMGVFDLKHDRFHNRVIKRFIDIVGAVVGLILFGPLIVILGALVYRESPGPIFFRQRRAGMDGKPFGILKIRSMRLDAESGSGQVWAVEDDPRRLKIGKFMRSWNLDELPQFWNVLKGDMSLVGPRPEMYDLVQGFRQTIRNYNLRHTLRPGLTGWAAVHGLRGNTSLEDRIEYDLFYIEHWSLKLDFLIIIMTIRPPKNAY